MEAIIPYLTFNGDAQEALNFYSAAFAGEIEFLQPFSASPVEVPADWKDKVMHASFRSGALQIMASDIMPGQKVTNGSNTSLSMNFSSPEHINEVFEKLSEGANITMPLQDTFWGARFGILTDKFGINWMLNYDYPKEEEA